VIKRPGLVRGAPEHPLAEILRWIWWAPPRQSRNRMGANPVLVDLGATPPHGALGHTSQRRDVDLRSARNAVGVVPAVRRK
jgi:hypothetical protein